MNHMPQQPQQPPYRGPVPQQHLGPQGPMPQGPYPPQYPPPKKGMNPAMIVVIVVVIVVGVIMVFGAAVGVLAVATIPKLASAKAELELKQMGDLQAAIQNTAVSTEHRRMLASPAVANQKGADLWSALFKEGALDLAMGRKVTSLMGGGSPVSGLPAAGDVDYTLPRGKELMSVLNMRGSKRTVMFTWNSRNWRNAGGEKVPVVWSDGAMAEWLTFEDAQTQFGISRSEWDDPAGKLFGKKAPFLHTFD